MALGFALFWHIRFLWYRQLGAVQLGLYRRCEPVFVIEPAYTCDYVGPILTAVVVLGGIKGIAKPLLSSCLLWRCFMCWAVFPLSRLIPMH